MLAGQQQDLKIFTTFHYLGYLKDVLIRVVFLSDQDVSHIN